MHFPYHDGRDSPKANFGGLTDQLLHAAICIVTVLLLLFKVLCSTCLEFCISPYHDVKLVILLQTYRAACYARETMDTDCGTHYSEMHVV